MLRLITDNDNRVLCVEYLQASKQGWVRALMNGFNRLANQFILLEPKLSKLLRAPVHYLRKRGQVRRLRVEQGVILNAGGFIASTDML